MNMQCSYLIILFISNNLIYININIFATVLEAKMCLLSRPTWVAGSPLKYRELNEGCRCLSQITSREPGTTHSAKNTRTPGPWVGWIVERGRRESMLGDPPETLTAPWSRRDLPSSSLAQGSWQKIWSDLTCDWYPIAAKNVLYWEGHLSLVPLITHVRGPSLPRGIKWADKLLMYRTKPKFWKQRAAEEPNESALNIQINWELVKMPVLCKREWPVDGAAPIHSRSQENKAHMPL